ncbi:MAG: hypothetical protein AB7E80_04600 [Hyphomicrobiaceae bacterium]
MKLAKIAAVAAVLIAGSAGMASAAPMGALAGTKAGDASGIVKVHGVHRSCQLGRWGWHRSLPYGGRVACSVHSRPVFRLRFGQRHDYDGRRGHYRRRHH